MEKDSYFDMPWAMHIALEKNNFDVVNLFLSKGFDINENLYYQFPRGNAMELAIERGSLEMAKFLVEKGAKIDGMLNKAAKFHKFDIVKFLLSKGANIKDPNVLEHAGYTENTEIIKYLLERGATSNANCFADQCRRLDLEGIKLLLDYGYKPLTLYHILRGDDNEKIIKAAEMLIKAGVKKVEDKNLIQEVCRQSRLPIIKFLVENGANPKNIEKITHNFTWFSWKIQDLMKNGTNPNDMKRIINGMSDFDIPTENLRYLIENGMNPNIEIANTVETRLETVNFLFTPLMIAAKNNDVEFINFLIRKGAKIDKKGEFNGEKTALEIAKRFDSKEAEELLMKL
jgi:ankyrin repeat protein